MPTLTGRVAIVTGSSRGIGLSVCHRLGRAGASLVVNARNVDQVAITVQELRAKGYEAVGAAANLRDDDAPARIVEVAASRYGRIDYVVNNAGASSESGPALRATRKAFVLGMTVNAWAPLAMVQAAVAAGLGEHPGAAVVNISTIGSLQVQPLLVAYTASKAAQNVVTKVLARELGPRGIRVNAIAPGLTRTTMAAPLIEGEQEAAESRLVPLQRLGDPDDIAGGVEFLLSDAAQWITGALLIVDGGRLTAGDEPSHLIGSYQL